MTANRACENWLETECGGKALLVSSCTSALEAAVALSIVPGEEVVLPSFAYPTCASSVIRAGGTPVFVDIDPDTLCLSQRGLGDAISLRTACVMPIWYAGAQGKLNTDISLIEDAAQCIGKFKLNGAFGCISFHHTKNVGCGEGGALIFKPELEEKVRTFCTSGTNRWKDRKDWTWLEVGTSCLMAEPLAKQLLPDLEACFEVTEQRLKVWKVYREHIKAFLKSSEPGNGHIFWFMSEKQRELLEKMPELRKHYEPLHLCGPAKYGRAVGALKNSIYASTHIVRPPMTVSEDEAFRIAERINGISLGRI